MFCSASSLAAKSNCRTAGNDPRWVDTLVAADSVCMNSRAPTASGHGAASKTERLTHFGGLKGPRAAAKWRFWSRFFMGYLKDSWWTTSSKADMG